MYEAFYGLRDKPFALLPDPAFLYLSAKHAAALSMLEYALSDQAGFVVITGEVGCGKTILIRRFLKLVDRDTTVGLISNTHNSFGDLLHWILVAFDIRPETDDKSSLYRALIDYLLEEYAAGRRTILVVDEAQNMSSEVLEELRLLSNLNADKDLLLQIILVGQPELLEKLRRADLRQFAQRIAVNYHLAPLDYPETRAYIRHRLQVAGGNPALFTEIAMAAVHCCTGGIPRLINQVCDMALVYGYAENLREIDFDTVMLVVEHKDGAGLGVLPEGIVPDRQAMRRRAEALLRSLVPGGSEPARPEAAAPAALRAGAERREPILAPQGDDRTAATRPAATPAPEALVTHQPLDRATVVARLVESVAPSARRQDHPASPLPAPVALPPRTDPPAAMRAPDTVMPPRQPSVPPAHAAASGGFPEYDRRRERAPAPPPEPAAVIYRPRTVTPRPADMVAPTAERPTVVSLSDQPPPRDLRPLRDDAAMPQRPSKRRRWVAWLV